MTSTQLDARDATVSLAVGEAAEGFVEALVSQGVDCLFLNPGTDTFPVQEAIVKIESHGRTAPRTVLCLFEIVALAAAHGYFAATGRPQAVMVHVDVGTQNLGSMLHNAQRGRAGVVIAAGRAPYTADPELRGSRSSYIHWLQEQADQHGIVRNYVKWDYELRRSDQVGEVVSRAFQIAASDPPGPVYMTLPREALMDAVGSVTLHRPERFPPARLGAGDPESLREAARRLVGAERPLVLTSSSGRSEAGYRGLLRLSELLALPVVEWRNRANFPGDHGLHQGYEVGPLLRNADVLLALDHDFPYIPSVVQPAADAFIIQLDLDPLKERIPLWTFPVDLPIRADSAQALDLIADEAERLLTGARRAAIEERRGMLAERHREQRASWRRAAEVDEGATPITLAWLGACLRALQAEQPDCVFVDEMVTSNEAIWRQVPAQEPGSWFGSNGSGLGWALGAALGVKLAKPEAPVIALVGDGSFVFGAPLAALWAMQTQDAPVMIVILNNTCYNATKRPLVANYPEGYSVREDRFVGVDLLPAPRYDLLANVVGAWGERVEEPVALLAALRRGLERVRDGQTAIVDVQLAHP
ncbi:MAG TPA: thiamine pyrophosphate-requiring protein [Thermomicrobiales bacterium]|nr:thiamine pyrophosphate-requiring protein [Thermomicrobiales bacterium]